MNVDNRRLTGDGHRFLQSANLQLDRNRDDRRSLELDVGPSDRSETWQ
jgi:hypothetical protein